LSHLSLDLEELPIGWVAYLNNIGVEIVEDSIGRSAVSSVDARMLIAEVRKAEKRAALERHAVESDQQFRAQLWSGVPADRLPPDVHPAAVMLQVSRDAQPKRKSVLQEALSRTDTLTFHSLAGHDADAL
jgi:hypothetical protein